MVDLLTHSLVALNSTASLPHQRKLIRMEKQNSLQLQRSQFRGLDLEKTSRFRSRRNFFLDIPFDRTH